MTPISAFRGTLAALGLAAALNAAPAAAQNLEFTAGSPGGSWFTQVTGLSAILQEKIPGLSLRVVPGGGKDNPSKIQAGISQLGMGLDFMAKAAYDGTAPYDAPADKLRSMGGTGIMAQFMVYVTDDEARPLAEVLTGDRLRIGVTPASTSENLTFLRTLDFLGTSEAEIRSRGGQITVASYGDLVSAFGDGQIDVFWSAGEIPSGLAAQVVSGRRQAKLLPFPEDLMDHLSETYGYGRSTIPAGTYPDLQDGDLVVSGMGNNILVSADVDEDVVKKITTVLIENHDRFGSISAAMAAYDPATAWQDQPIPLHPGAEAAFRELGYMQ